MTAIPTEPNTLGGTRMTAEIVKAGGALAIRPDQTAWTPEQAAVLRQSGINDQVTAAELSGFLHLCQRTQLDPFSRQIYLIGRWDRRAQREVFTPQTGIDGYRVVAHRVIAASGEAFGYEDTLWCDESGQWRDVWLSNEPPAAAKVTVIRNGMRFSAVALFREYAQTGKENRLIGLWGKMPAGQVAKCAEALALRKAFPHDLAGVYTAEEMAQADNPPQAADRHLRQVQPGESDPWATAAPAPAARDWVAEAEAAPGPETVRELWQAAKGTGAPDDVLARLVEIGRAKTAEAATAAEAQTEPVDAEIVPDADDDHSAAVAELRAAAEAAHLDNFDEGAEQALGLPVEEASAASIRALAAQIRSAA